jgi:stage II sporulation protein M
MEDATMFTRQGFVQSWKEVRPYFVFSIMLFFAGLIIGASPGAPSDWLGQQLKGIEQISKIAHQSDRPQWAMFQLIFLNNFVKSVLAMVLGAVAGLFPVYMLVANGMVMGFLLGRVADQGENVWLLVVRGLLPHGVLELSAIFLACAFGLRFGVTLLQGIAGSVFGKERAWYPFVRTATGSVPALILVFAVLLVAAIVESTITYWLMT